MTATVREMEFSTYTSKALVLFCESIRTLFGFDYNGIVIVDHLDRAIRVDLVRGTGATVRLAEPGAGIYTGLALSSSQSMCGTCEAMFDVMGPANGVHGLCHNTLGLCHAISFVASIIPHHASWLLSSININLAEDHYM
jgi:hypothetical protein